MERISQLLLTFLLNACWQAALVAAVALLCARLLRGTPARQRHLLWVAALVLSCCLPALSSYSSDAPTVDDVLLRQPPAGQRVFESDLRTPAPSQVAPSPDASARVHLNKRLAGLLLTPYFLFLFYRAARLLRAWRKTRALMREARPAPVPAHVRAVVDQYRRALAVGAVEIYCSQGIAVPVTVGALRPRIIVPESLLDEADAEVWAAAVGHELAHVRRRDYVCNLLYELLRLPLAFHPALALVRRRVGETRELACDELVTERLLGAHAYARSLMQLASSIPALRGRHTVTTTLGINGANILEERIMTLLGKGPQLSLRRKKIALAAAAVLLVGSCVAATAFTLRIGVDRYDPPAATQDKRQEPDAAREKKQELDAAQREEHKRRELEEMKREHKERAEMSPAERAERARHEQAEREERARTIREAKLSMAQAIQIATNAQAGTVLNSVLVRERDQPCYKIVVASGDEPNTTYTIMLVSALDGQILVSKTEH